MTANHKQESNQSAALTPCRESFLKLLRASLRETEETVSPQEGPSLVLGEKDWEELLRLSAIHKVTALIYEALSKFSVEDVPERIRHSLRDQALSICISEVRREAAFLNVLRSAEEAGFKPILVKGIVCRSLYPKPDLRPSTDEDLLVRPDALTGLSGHLQKEGFSLLEDLPSGEIPDEISVFNRKTGLYLELHTKLFPGESSLDKSFNHIFNDSLFDEAGQYTEAFPIGGIEAVTLDDTYHLLYLFCHYLKHFLRGGVGIRQLCDIILMAEKREASIDWGLLRSYLDDLNMTVFCSSLMEIGRSYLGFSCPSWEKTFERPSQNCLPLLNDILDAGLFGDSSEERKHSANMTLDAMERKSADHMAGGVLHSLFPSAKYMRKQFPYLEKRPWLLPSAYVVRISRYLRGRSSGTVRGHSSGTVREHSSGTVRGRSSGTMRGRSTGIAGKSSLDYGRERVGLLRQYGLLEKSGPRRVETKAYIDMLVDIAETGKSVSLIISGSSMTPFLAGERDRVVFEKPGRELKVGDIILFLRDDGQYVLHRICRIDSKGYYAVGDAQTYIEGPIREDQIRGLVTAAERKGKVLKPGDPLWDFFEKQWIHMIPLRPAAIKTYTAAARILKG